ncbi:DUF3048 domain-containing protein [Streptomyces cadmiisoli]|uniref:DUF3048 domain-containing protein n=1 Tax=Streptomyces cadmiisoli TaxID=2184053 RepID=A0A2Z4IWZ3_9ACTN|nr:DUF3048 domain-containing protein [Streptomyces cadmiisoli]AWW36703.1 DUF3048 domain-containing protein [Streptomyces cadmiisoli]
MGRTARARRAAAAVVLLAAAMTASLTTGCTNGRGPADDGRGPATTPTPSPRPSDSGDDEAVADAGPVLAVKIDNVRGARPQTGLTEADVVYVEQVEGGLSRLMAVYASRLPKVVGPVRSARETDLELLRQFDRPTLAFSGAQRKLTPLIDGAPLRAEPPGRTSGAYFRAADEAAPHNLYLRPGRVLPEAPGAEALTTGFTFGAAPAGGTAQRTRTVRFPAARFTFTWSAERGRYLVTMDGTPATTADGTRLAPATVVVQYVRVRRSEYFDARGNNTPFSETVGTGKALVLRDGTTHSVNWRRATAGDGTRFTTGDGTPVNLAPGQVWVVLVKA